MTNHIKQIGKRFSLGLIGLFFAISFIGPIVLTTQSTKAADDTIDARVFSYQAYKIMTAGDCVWNTDLMGTDASSWMPTGWAGNGQNKNIAVGEVFFQYAQTPSVELECSNQNGWIDKAVKLWGFESNFAFLEALVNQNGLKKEAGGYKVINNQALDNAITKALQNKSYYNSKPLNGLTDAEKYYDSLINFQVACDAVFSADGSIRTDSDKLTDKTNVVSVDGTAQNGYWLYTGNQTFSVGNALTSGTDGRADCEFLAANVLNKTLQDAYKNYIGSGGEIPPAADEQSGSGDTANTGSCFEIINPLTWILCPVIDIADGLYGFLTSQIQSLLTVESDLYDTDNLKQSWAAMRNIASALIVLVALVMVAGQIFNFEFMSAYAIKKVLPRLVIAVILIQLSWFIFTLMIVIMNDIGNGIYTLMLAPFDLNGAGSDIIDMLGSQTEGQKLFSGTLAIVAGVGGFIAVGGLAGMVGAAIAVSFAILAALVTLILRKMLLIALLVLAPIALVAWILPGTQKLWDTWWQLFSKLLIMFPLIMILIASGKIFASLMVGNKNPVTPIVIIIAYFIPLFFIPATFKFAGGIFAKTTSTISGMSNKWGKQAGGLAKTKTGGWASSQYGSNKFKNAFARSATGSILPTQRARARTAKAGTNYFEEKKGEINALLASRLYGKTFADQDVEMVKIANDPSEKIDLRNASMRELARKGRFAEFDKINDKSIITAFGDMDSEFGSTMAAKRIDLMNPGKIPQMGEEALLGQHDAFWGAGNVDRAQISREAIQNIRNNPLYYGKLDIQGKTYVNANSAVPPVTPGGGNPQGPISNPNPQPPVRPVTPGGVNPPGPIPPANPPAGPGVPPGGVNPTPPAGP